MSNSPNPSTTVGSQREAEAVEVVENLLPSHVLFRKSFDFDFILYGRKIGTLTWNLVFSFRKESHNTFYLHDTTNTEYCFYVKDQYFMRWSHQIPLLGRYGSSLIFNFSDLFYREGSETVLELAANGDEKMPENFSVIQSFARRGSFNVMNLSATKDLKIDKIDNYACGYECSLDIPDIIVPRAILSNGKRNCKNIKFEVLEDDQDFKFYLVDGINEQLVNIYKVNGEFKFSNDGLFKFSTLFGDEEKPKHRRCCISKALDMNRKEFYYLEITRIA